MVTSFGKCYFTIGLQFSSWNVSAVIAAAAARTLEWNSLQQLFSINPENYFGSVYFVANFRSRRKKIWNRKKAISAKLQNDSKENQNGCCFLSRF